MNTKLISYDLNKTGQDYEKVIAYIKSLGSWAKPLRSQFFVKTDLSDAAIITGLKQNGADSTDSLLVVDVTGDSAAWSNLPTEVSQWMKDNI